MKTTRFILASLFFILLSQSPLFGFTLLPPKEPTADEQVTNAIQPAANPAASLSGQVSGAITSALTDRNSTSRGLQFKDPVLSLGSSWRNWEDSSDGGFSGNDIGADAGIDFDVYDGLITGLMYNHTYRAATNKQNTSEHLHSNGASLYAAKRFFGLMNTGISYNFTDADHRLTRSVEANLDRASNGFTLLFGTSDRNGKWAWNVTPSYTHIFDDYSQRNDLETGIFALGSGLSYDAHKIFTLGASLRYTHFITQDLFSNDSVPDVDYWTLGPRFLIYPTEEITIDVEYSSMEGFKDNRSYYLRLGVDVAF